MIPKTLIKELKNRLSTAKRVVVLGIGSELKMDDGAGKYIADLIRSGLKKRKYSSKVCVIFGSTAPESMTGVIIKHKPDHLIMIDAADVGKKPGSVALINPQDIIGVSFSTHMLPLEIMVEYLVQSCGTAVTILGIQPKNIDYGSGLTPPMKKAVKELSTAVLNSIK